MSIYIMYKYLYFTYACMYNKIAFSYIVTTNVRKKTNVVNEITRN